ncbi:MAG: hypothetical protein KAT35_01480, partial [Candidatus Aenigmarchaeota archaeon]|nr:hypothetical protein [Candidatus Aenigmarchaeota archaeon]
GVLLRSFPMTRSVGGALIAVAVAFYLALPAAVLINAMIYEQHYGTSCVTGFMGYSPERIKAIGGGWKHYAWDVLLTGTDGRIPALFGKIGIGFAILGLVFGGFGTIPWIISGAVIGVTITTFILSWAREVIFMVVILGFVGMVIDYMITFTFARELSRILGADINLSALLKIL